MFCSLLVSHAMFGRISSVVRAVGSEMEGKCCSCARSVAGVWRRMFVDWGGGGGGSWQFTAKLGQCVPSIEDGILC